MSQLFSCGLCGLCRRVHAQCVDHLPPLSSFTCAVDANMLRAVMVVVTECVFVDSRRPEIALEIDFLGHCSIIMRRQLKDLAVL